MAGNYARAALSIAVGIVFLASSLPKLRHPKGFLFTVLQYDILPQGLARAYAHALPIVELFIATCLLLGLGIGPIALVATGLLLTFIVGVVTNLLRGRDLDCGCFGKRQRKIGWPLVVQDLGLMAACIALAFLAHPLVFNPASWSLLAGIHLYPSQLTVVLPVAISLAGTALARRWPRRDSRWTFTPADI